MQWMNHMLSYGDIATNRTESIRPDLYPTYAWGPCFGNTGKMLPTLGEHYAELSGAPVSNIQAVQSGSWRGGGIYCNTDSAQNIDTDYKPWAGSRSMLLAVREADWSTGSTNVIGEQSDTDRRFLIGAAAAEGQYLFGYGSGRLPSGKTTTSGSHVLAWTSDNSNMWGYVDGAYCATTAATYGGTGVALDTIDLGMRPSGGTHAGNALAIDAVVMFVGIWHRTLTHDQMVALTQDPILPFRTAGRVSVMSLAGLSIPIILNQARRRRT